MVDSVYESFIGVAVFVAAFLVATYIVKVTTLTKVFTGLLLVLMFVGYISVLLGLDGSAYILSQLSSMSDYNIISDYGNYIYFFLFYVCFLNSVGIGKK